MTSIGAPTSRMYVITAFGGGYSDSWENSVAVCASSQKAEAVRKELTKKDTKKVRKLNKSVREAGSKGESCLDFRLELWDIPTGYLIKEVDYYGG